MARNERVDVKAILADPDLRRKLMVRTIQATQAREGIETTEEQAERAYYVVTEGERATFFALQPFSGTKKNETDTRNEAFVRCLHGAPEVRFDVARRDLVWLKKAFSRSRVSDGLHRSLVGSPPSFLSTGAPDAGLTPRKSTVSSVSVGK